MVSFGALVAAVPAFYGPRPVLCAGMLGLAVFRAPFGALLDALLLDSARPFGPIRAWGTVGYVFGALATGFVIAQLGPDGVALSTLVFLVLAALAALFVREPRTKPARSAPDHAESKPARAARRASLLAVLARPRFLLLLLIAFLFELGLAPYDTLFPAYLTRLSSSVVATTALAVGAVAEFLFLLGVGRWTSRGRASTLLAAAGVASVARWATIAFVTAPAALVATQALHSLSFGAFYVASVVLVNEESSASAHTTAQGVFRAFTFGLAPAVAVFLAGRVEGSGGLRAVFLVAAGAAAMGALLAASMRSGRGAARATG